MSEKVHSVTVAPATAPERIHPVVAAAMRGGQVDPATLRELLAIQREWEAGEARRAYTAAMVALKAELPAVLERDTVVDYTSTKGRVRYSHTSLAAAVDAISDPLSRHGFSLAWVPSTDERGGVKVTCRLTHAEGHFEEATLAAPADASGGKSAVQAIASTITLLERYTALALLGIATRGNLEEFAPPDAVDPARNLRAVTHLRGLGVALEDAEKHVDRRVSEWTKADLDALRDLAASKKGGQS
jgi:hypothetical protein